MADIYFKAIEKFGATTQMRKTVEECGELIVSLMHYIDGKEKAIDVCGEIADVDIMCQQMKALFGPKVEDIKRYKLEKLEKLIINKQQDKQ